MDIQRLVVENPPNALTLDFHPGLTVAFHENPVQRSRCLTDLVDGLGAARAGIHLELTDDQGHHLVVFRPHGRPHQVIDIDASAEVTERFAGPGGRVDLLAPYGIDLETAHRTVRMGARHLDRGLRPVTDDDERARRLAAVDQATLWAAADEVDRTGEAVGRLLADLPVDDAHEVALLADAFAVHDRVARTVRAHRPVQRGGPVLAVLCVVLGVALLAWDGPLGDNRMTALALPVLGALAAVVTALDRKVVTREQHQDETLLAGYGVSSFDELTERAGPLADPERRTLVLEADTAHRAATAAWDELTGGVPLDWAHHYRSAIEALAAPGRSAAPAGSPATGGVDEPGLTDAARLLVDKVIELQHLGPAGIRLPLLLDEPFAGFSPAAVHQLLEAVLRLSRQHQVLLVTGDPFVQVWATDGPAATEVGFVRLGRGTDSAPADDRTRIAG